MFRLASAEQLVRARIWTTAVLVAAGIALSATASAQQPPPQQSPTQQIRACQQTCAKTQKKQKAYRACRQLCVEEATAPKPTKEPR